MLNKRIISFIVAAIMSLSICLPILACGDNGVAEENFVQVNTFDYDIPQDYYRTYYQIYVRSFSDGNGDGKGDFRGLINNLDYLNDGNDSTMTDLGINGIWLMPFNDAKSGHGYDVTNYKDVDPDYGTLDDFDELVSECNKRNIWLQMDLVLNHTSDTHPWFVRALADARNGETSATSEYMARYVFFEDGEQMPAEVQEVSNSSQYYLCNFGSGMPDLNLDNAFVRGYIEEVVEFWLDRGVRSFRLDAVPLAYGNSSTYTGDDGLDFWTWFNDMCNEKCAAVARSFGWNNENIPRYCYNVGEVWSGTQQITTYFKTGMSAFNYAMGGNGSAGFPKAMNGLGGGAAAAVESIAAMQATVRGYSDYAILSNFLSNHDNDRSAGYMMYDVAKIKAMASLYLLMPGNSYTYYGEEIGAEGIRLEYKTDSNRRLPFNWGDSAKGIVPFPTDSDYKKDQRLGTWKSQTGKRDSILTYYRNAISLRNRFPEIARGVITPYAVDKDGSIKLMSTVRENNDIAAGTSLIKVNSINKTLAVYELNHKGSTIIVAQNIGNSKIEAGISAFGDVQIVAQLGVNGGNVSVENGKLVLSPYTVAILKSGIN